MTALAAVTAPGDQLARYAAAYPPSMRPDPELVEHYRQVLDAIPKGAIRNASAFGTTVGMIREAAEAHEARCAGCETCHHLRQMLAFVLAYELTSVPAEGLRKIHGMGDEGD